MKSNVHELRGRTPGGDEPDTEERDPQRERQDLVFASLQPWLEGNGSFLPMDGATLQQVARPKLDDEDPEDIERAVADLVAAKRFRRVIIGDEPHICRPRGVPDRPQGSSKRDEAVTAGGGTAAESPSSTAPRDREATQFKVQVEMDMEYERGLLLRVVIVVEVIVALILVRELLATLFL